MSTIAAPVAPAKPSTEFVPPSASPKAANAPAPAAAPAPKPQADAPVPKNPMQFEPDLRSVNAQFTPKPPDAPAAQPAKAPAAPKADAQPEPKPEAKAEVKADAAPVTPAEEPSALDQLKEHEGMTEANKSHFKKLRETAKTEINALKNERAALAAKLKTYETATPADTARVAELEAKLKQASDTLAVYDVQHDPVFVQQYVEPKKMALKTAQEILGYQTTPKETNFEKLLAKPLKEFNAELSELTKDMNVADAQTTMASLRKAYEISGGEREALNKASDLKRGYEAQRAAAAKQAFEETRNEIKTKVQLLTVPEGASEDRAREITEYNESVTAAMADAEKYSFGKMTERDVARVAHEAAMLKPVAQKLIPMLQRDLKASTELVSKLTAELEAIKSKKNPGTFAGAPDSSSRPPVTPNQPFGRGATMPDFGNIARSAGVGR